MPPDDEDEEGSENERNEHNDDDSEDSQNSAPDGVRTESQRFRNAETEGRRRAAQQNTTRPIRKNPHDDFAYTVFDSIHQSLGSTPSHTEHAEAYVTAQMSAKKGLNVFGQQGADAQMKELRQLVSMKVMMSGVESHKLTKEQKHKSLKYLMFLKEKRYGHIKDCGCANGRKQRLCKTKEENTSPTVSLKAVLLSCMIDAMQGCDVATLDIPGVFMQAMIDEEIHIKFDRE